MKFREATIDDIPALTRVRQSVKENVLSDPGKVTPEMYRAYLSKSGKGWLCEFQGEVVGFSVASLADSSIWALFVLPVYEGKGIGKGLLQLATDWLFQMKATSIVLSTSPDTRADRFYEQQGWLRGGINANGEVCFRLHATAGTE